MVFFSSIGVAVASFFGATIAAGTFAAIAIGVTTQVVLGAALRALTPKPKLPSFNRTLSSSGYQVNSYGSTSDHQIIYGQARVGGVIVFDEATGSTNQYLERIIAIAGHEVDSFVKFYIDEEEVTVAGNGLVTSPAKYKDKIRILTKNGSPNQSAQSSLVAASTKWTSNHRLRGIAYMYVRFTYDADVFPRGVPTVTALVKGKKVYDPETGSTAWSDNPALCLRDYLTTSSYGLGELAANIDDTLVISAKGVCNQTASGITRYTCNGEFLTSATPYDTIDDLLTSMGGTLWYSQGKWRMKPAYWTTPVLDLDEDDLRSSISVSTRHSRRDNFNTVKGTFRGAETSWQVTDYPQVTNSDFLSADNGQGSVADVDLPFTDNSVEARRLARIALEGNRQQLVVNASFGLRALSVQVGDNVRLTNTRFGWDDKEFMVVAWTFGLSEGLDLRVDMTLKETAASVFDEVSDGATYERDNTNLPDPFAGLSVTNLAVAGGGKTQSDGTFISSAIISWDAAESAFVSDYEVEWKPLSDSDYSSTTTTNTSIELSPIIDDVEYVFRVKAVSAFANAGSVASVTYTVGGDTVAPNPPTGLSATAKPRSISLNWTNPSNLDLKTINIYQKESATPVPVIGVDVPIASVVGQSHLVENILPLDEKFYWVTAVDYTGNESALSNMASAISGFLAGEDLEDLSVDTIKVTDDAITSITTFNSTLPYINTISGEDQYGDFFTILEYVDNPETRPNVFGALRYSVSGTAGVSPQVRLQTQIGFLGSGGSLITLAQTETVHTGSPQVFGEFMHNITYDSTLNTNGSGIIIARAYVQGISSPVITAQGYGMARRR